MRRERTGKRNEMLREVVSGKIREATVVVMTIPTVFCRAVPDPMFYYCDDTTGVQAIRAILDSGDIGFHYAFRGVRIFAKGSVGPRPPRFRGQVRLRRERLANANRCVLLTHDISETACEIGVVQGRKTQRLGPHGESSVLYGRSEDLFKMMARI